MKRMHVHVSVDDLAQSTRFYSTLFAAEPTVVKDDYVKWMLDDPRVNFAISTRPGRASGISHLGIQAEDETELAEVYDRLSRAERPTVEAKGATGCYHQSDKQWIADPQGVPWETFYTYGASTVYGEGSRAKLKEVSTATICTALFKRGFRNQFIQNVHPLNPDLPNMVGEAFTLRYIPAREDLNPISIFLDRAHPQRVAIEQCPAGAVLMVDSRGDALAASAGGILLARLMVRGAAGFVTDGGLRDTGEIAFVKENGEWKMLPPQ